MAISERAIGAMDAAVYAAEEIAQLRTINAKLLAACEKMVEAVYQKDAGTMYCRFCGNYAYGRKPRHTKTCPVRELEANVAEAQGAP